MVELCGWFILYLAYFHAHPWHPCLENSFQAAPRGKQGCAEAAGLFDGRIVGWAAVPWVSPWVQAVPGVAEEGRGVCESGWVLLLRQSHSVPPTQGPSSHIGPCPHLTFSPTFPFSPCAWTGTSWCNRSLVS